MTEYTLETYAGNTLRFWRFGTKVEAIQAMILVKHQWPEATGKLTSLVTLDDDVHKILETEEF